MLSRSVDGTGAKSALQQMGPTPNFPRPLRNRTPKNLLLPSHTWQISSRRSTIHLPMREQAHGRAAGIKKSARVCPATTSRICECTFTFYVHTEFQYITSFRHICWTLSSNCFTGFQTWHASKKIVSVISNKFPFKDMRLVFRFLQSFWILAGILLGVTFPNNLRFLTQNPTGSRLCTILRWEDFSSFPLAWVVAPPFFCIYSC